MFTIGVDIGGTKIRGILWNGKRVIRARELPTPKNRDDFEKNLLALTSFLGQVQHVRTIGIGAAGIVQNASLVSSPNIPFIKKFSFRSLWPSPRALRVDNDARCLARAEFLGGAGRGYKSLFALTLGTGVGRGYGRNGKILKIKKLEYPERWEKEYQSVRNRQDSKKLANFLGGKLARLLKPFKPEVIVIGGGVVERPGFLKRLRAQLKESGLGCPVRRAALGKNAAAIGAALLFAE